MMRFDGTLWRRLGREWNVPPGRKSAAMVDADGTFWLGSLTQIARLPRGAHRFETIDTLCRGSAEFIQAPDSQTWCVNLSGTFALPGRPGAASRDASFNSRMRA